MPAFTVTRAFAIKCGLTMYVKVEFFCGTSLRPLPPGESRQKEVRYFDIHEVDQLDEVQLAAWVKQASQSPGWGKASNN